MSSESRKIEKELKKTSISLNKFFATYCGITEDNFIKKKMNHHDIKTLMPYLRRMGLLEVYKNKDWLASGKVIIVSDSYGNIAPYIVSSINIIDQNINFENNKNNSREEKLEKVILDENFSRYELVLLCRYFKEHKREEEYWVANRLLKKKKDSEKVKAYKKEKYNLKMKGREDYEEF